MTGFARAEGCDGGDRWAWEVRSVNARNLDVRVRLPPGLEHLEAEARGLARTRFRRGGLSIHLSLERAARPNRYRLNREALADMLGLIDELKAAVGTPPPRAEALIALPGVLEPVGEEEPDDRRGRRDAAMIETLRDALDETARMRAGEGARLAVAVEEHVAAIDRRRAEAADAAALQPAAIRDRLRERLAGLLDGESRAPEDRIAQEVALLASRADVREELDRLAAHVAAARDLIRQGGAVGRRLDFLCQEFNREANTFCAKAAELKLTQIGLELKAAVERLREQVQNIE